MTRATYKQLTKRAELTELHAVFLRRLRYPDAIVKQELAEAQRLHRQARRARAQQRDQLTLEEGIDNADW